MTLYGYARVSVREPENKNLDLQVERLVRAGCSMGNIRAEEASGAKDDRSGLLELLDLVVKGGHPGGHPHRPALQGADLRAAGDRGSAPGGSVVPVPVGGLRHGHGQQQAPFQMVLAFSEWWRTSIRDRSAAGKAKARAEGRFPGRRPSLSEWREVHVRGELSKGVRQRELAKPLEVSRWTTQQVDR